MEKNETTLFQKGIIRGIEGSDGKHNGKYVMKKKEAVLSQREDQYLEELVVSKLANYDRGRLFYFRKYDEELQQIEDWLLNPRIDQVDHLMGKNIEMFSCSIGKENMEGKDMELSCNDMILLQHLVYSRKEPKDIVDIEI